MRVLYDHQAFSIQPRGGISRYFLELAARFAAGNTVQPRIAAGWHRSEAVREAAAPWITGHYVRPWPKTLRIRLALNAEITRRAVHAWRPDLVHETYFRFGRAYSADVPTVLTVYDLTYFTAAVDDSEARRVRAAQTTAVRRADRIICISESTRRDLLHYIPTDPARVHVIHLGCPVPAAMAATQPTPLDQPYLLHVGLRHSYKNFAVLLRAFARWAREAPGYRLVAFGGGDFTATERAQIRALGLDATRVVWAGGDDARLGSYYAHAAALVCPSLYEGFGLPAVEAMGYGCPVLATNRGSLPEIAGDAALFFNPTSDAELVQTLARFEGSPELRRALSARGLQRAATFSWDRCASETLAVYQLLM